MEFRDYLIAGEQAAGGREELAAILKQQPNAITDAKAGRRGLPLVACWKLAELIGESKEAVTAASALNTEKDEEVRAYLRPFAQAARHAQHLTIAILAGATAFSLAIENSVSTMRSFLL